MLISKSKPNGKLVESFIVDFLVRSIIDIRQIGSTFIIYLYDDVDEGIQHVDPYFIYSLVISGKDVDSIIKKISKSLNVNYEDISLVWTRWFKYYGILTPLLLYDKITDIYLTTSNFYAYHSDFGLCEVNVEFENTYVDFKSTILKFVKHRLYRRVYSLKDFLEYVISRVAERSSSPITTYMPMISVTDHEFRVRFSISIKPISEPYIHIRILPRSPWTYGDLIVRDSVDFTQCALLWYLFDNKIPILIIGPMGSGKTSLANAITFCSNPTLFKALIMDVDEMTLPGHNVVKLIERRSYGLGVKSITKSDLIAHALRIGADYIIVNEVRTRDEVQAWIDAVTTGHGGVTTFHADSYDKLKMRLSNMIENSQNILKEIAVVKMHTGTTIVELDGVRICRKIRKVSDIYIPNSVEIPRDEIEYRREIIKNLVRKSYTQQLSIISEFYKRPEEVITNIVYRSGAGGGI